ncbi:Uma2 family endonuclease [Sphaerisporangium sp. TRM90804]|uniref:Uma2 family endonuclease n=1 Tax=Sphaerisporangium sp. TRM90804 TaxID=3031113 RepID=UPI002447A1A2|nr:Uma2 family endonuclease [Sphaerisporangium sp. TRM90804]MDH2427762.1 Uma2 family endonuclease [Sphaerisporangium sp. TRM90804]
MSALPQEGWLVPRGGRAHLVLLPDHPGPYTVEDWLALPETEERVELIDGSFVVSPAPATDHALCAQRLVRILLDAAPDDVEVVEAANVQVGEEGFIPDVVVGRAEPIARGSVVLGADDVLMVVEIVGPGNGKRDYVVKPPSYAEAGVPVFMRVESHGRGVRPLVEVFRERDGKYEPLAEARAGRSLSVAEPFPIEFEPAALAGARRPR